MWPCLSHTNPEPEPCGTSNTSRVNASCLKQNNTNRKHQNQASTKHTAHSEVESSTWQRDWWCKQRRECSLGKGERWRAHRSVISWEWWRRRRRRSRHRRRRERWIRQVKRREGGGNLGRLRRRRRSGFVWRRGSCYCCYYYCYSLGLWESFGGWKG